MIKGSATLSRQTLEGRHYHTCIYGLGYETRSIHVATALSADRVYALRMPPVNAHSYDRNLALARGAAHVLIDDVEAFLHAGLRAMFSGPAPLTLALDISSMNRLMMADVLAGIAGLIRPTDVLDVFYTPSSYREPDWRFPQIERIGPLSPEFTAFEANPALPLCLILGLGFEPGVSMGIINQLEPRLAYCFWGAGVDAKFDGDVRRANFDFKFPGFQTRTVSYPMKDPGSSYFMLESLTSGLVDGFNVLFVPMGPKIFTLLTLLVALTYRGRVSVWRAKQRSSNPPDAKPGDEVILAELDGAILQRIGEERARVAAR